MCFACNRTKATSNGISVVPLFLERVRSNPDKLVQAMAEATKGVDYDTMVTSGMSGALVIPTLADKLGKKWAIVRKSDMRHAEGEIIGQIGHKWMFVDDFTGEGKNRDLCKQAIRDMSYETHFYPEYVGTYVYQPYGRSVTKEKDFTGYYYPAITDYESLSGNPGNKAKLSESDSLEELLNLLSRNDQW